MINILLSLRAFENKKIYDSIKPYIKKDMKVCVLAYSFFEMFYPTEEAYSSYYSDQGPYYEKIINSFSMFGINELIWIDYYKDSMKEAIKKIEDADILYLPGGAPDEMMKRVIEKGLLKTLNDFNKTVIGVFAGAMIQFKNYYIAPDAEYKKFSEENGLNYINAFFIEVHYRRRKKQKSSIRKMWRKYKKDMYVIPNDGCIIIDHSHIKCIYTARKLYNYKGIIK
ncbi:Type 1 glutamine amidotransferase-like domain-containing protein [Mycoplasmatota bacterium]|nr:Type 1 glutamine amidotransferase-like domain-containing protein [Mycoplasmatota bacterium]